MNYEDVTLSKLALASFMFNSLTPYNASLLKLRSDAGGKLDLKATCHRKAAVEWLNDWGCRHLPKEQHGVALESIRIWYEAHCRGLFSEEKPLWQLEDGELSAVSSAYASLRDKLGAWRIRDGERLEVRIGPTAASKILFAIRPKALMPWDDAMRTALKQELSLRTYLEYLLFVRDLTLYVDSLCRNQGFRIEDLPLRLGRRESTVIELVNEYIWVTVPRKDRRPVVLPSSATLAIWAKLG